MFRRLSPPAVYITREAESDERCARRVERMLGAIDCDHIERGVTDERLAEIVQESGWQQPFRWGQQAAPRDPAIVFNTCKNDHSPEERERRLEQFPALRFARLSGYGGFDFRSDGSPAYREREGRICQSAWEFHTIWGCPFRCAYCWFGAVLNVMVDIEAFLEHADRRIRELDPPQTIYKWDNGTDINCFEPEYDATRLMVDYFARQERNRLLLYTGKSDHVDFMLDYPHGGHTIIQWSLSGRTQSTVLEPETAPWNRRVEAAAKCQAAGYPIRFRFSPIIPVRGWREENRELIELIFATTRPDIMVLCMLGWMDYDVAAACVDMSLLDEQMVRAMEGTAPFLKGRRYGPLPHDARAEIYRFLFDEIRRVSPNTPVTLCLETPAMWAEFGRRPPQVGASYPCVCGPYCTPGHPKFLPTA
ncbi:MAG: hypothetical protein ISS72_00225 [Candidatus Brocadiae bacterium]|nr:hypothetical protein [Candidatus Brocadiia bacterium]